MRRGSETRGTGAPPHRPGDAWMRVGARVCRRLRGSARRVGRGGAAAGASAAGPCPSTSSPRPPLRTSRPRAVRHHGLHGRPRRCRHRAPTPGPPRPRRLPDLLVPREARPGTRSPRPPRPGRMARRLPGYRRRRRRPETGRLLSAPGARPGRLRGPPAPTLDHPDRPQAPPETRRAAPHHLAPLGPPACAHRHSVDVDLFVEPDPYRDFRWNTGGRFALDITASHPVVRVAICVRFWTRDSWNQSTPT